MITSTTLTTTQGITKNLKSGLSTTSTIGTEASSNLEGGISSRSSSVLGTASSIASNIMSRFSTGTSSSNSIGSNIISGIMSGLTSGVSSLCSVASGVASSLLSTMKKALGIKSPSKVMRDMVGKFIPLGISVGIESEADSVYNSILDIVDDVKDIDVGSLAISSALNVSYDSINEKLNTNSAITVDNSIVTAISNAIYTAISKAMEESKNAEPITIEGKWKGKSVLDITINGINERTHQSNKFALDIPLD